MKAWGLLLLPVLANAQTCPEGPCQGDPTPPAPYTCIHGTPTNCEAVAPNLPSYTFYFAQNTPPPVAGFADPPAVAAPEIGASGAGAALTLLAGMLQLYLRRR